MYCFQNHQNPVTGRCFVRTEDVQVCDKQIGITVGKKTIIWEDSGFECIQTGNVLECDSLSDGNGDGIITRGESGCTFEIDNNLKKSCNLDTPSIKRQSRVFK